MADLKINYQYFLDNKNHLIKEYCNKYVVIVDAKVVNSFDDENEAYRYSVNEYGLGKFIIQLCSPNESDYSMTFHSRVSFEQI